jgi:hypothetical protein
MAFIPYIGKKQKKKSSNAYDRISLLASCSTESQSSAPSIFTQSVISKEDGQYSIVFAILDGKSRLGICDRTRWKILDTKVHAIVFRTIVSSYFLFYQSF